MTELIRACPDCDGSNLQPRSQLSGWYCEDCNERVSPVRRQPDGQRNTQSKTARRLLDMDADDVGGSL